MRTPQRPWTEEEVSYLRANYYEHDMAKICEHLDRKDGGVVKKAKKLKLKSRHAKRFDYSALAANLMRVTKPEAAYFLGFMWADGHVEKSQARLAINREDGLAIMSIVTSLGEMSINENWRKDQSRNNGPSIRFNICNMELVRFLEGKDYDRKSLVSPCKILATIPSALHRYFFLGWSDGDGCFYCHAKTGKGARYSIAGDHDTDFSLLASKMREVAVECRVYKTTSRKGHRSAAVTTKTLLDIVRWGEYLYQTYAQDSIGLKRKHKKYCDIREGALNNRYTWIREAAQQLQSSAAVLPIGPK